VITEGDGNQGFKSRINTRNLQYATDVSSEAPFVATPEMNRILQLLADERTRAHMNPSATAATSAAATSATAASAAATSATATSATASSVHPSQSSSPVESSCCADRNFVATKRQSKTVMESGIWALTDDYGFLRVILNIKLGETNGISLDQPISISG
jgi:cobalamin biosynthesis Mg chelatase CobN